MPLHSQPQAAQSGSAFPTPVATKTTTYSASAGEFVPCDVSSAGFTVTLPAAPATGAVVGVKKVDSSGNTLTIAPAGGGTIDGDANATTVTQWAGAIFQHIGSNVWRVVASMTTTGAQGPTGATGAAGANGVVWFSGSGVPSSGTGADGDYYVRTSNGEVYKKVAGAWVDQSFSLVGPQGTTGATGAAGTNGAISQIQDEGSNLTVRSTVSFEGAGVTATDNGSKTVVTIPGGGSGGGVIGYGIGLVTGRYGLISAATFSGPESPDQDVEIAYPVYFNKAATLTKLGVHCWAGSASAVVRTALRADTGSGPGAVLAGGGSVSAASAGLLTETISCAVQAFTPYWITFVMQGAADATFLCLSEQGIVPGATVDASEATATLQAGYGKTGVTGALSNTWGSLARTGSKRPRIFIGS